MAELSSDLRLALRSLIKRPGFSLLVILALGLGIGVNVSVFSFVQTLLLRPLPYFEADRLVRISVFKGEGAGRLSQREIEDVERHAEAFDGVAAYYHSQYLVTGDGAPESAPCAIGTHDLFDVVGARFALGGPYSGAEDFRRQYRVVLEHGFWQSRFGGDPDVVGKTIVLDGGFYVVDGVLAAGAAFPPGVKLYRQVTEYYGLDGRRHSAVARLRAGATLRQAQGELDRLSQRWAEQRPALNRGLRFEVVPLRDSWVGPARPYLLLLSLGVGFVLLIAVLNAANLLLARGIERRQEMALRRALGASRSSLLRQLLAESLVLAGLGGVLGLALAAGWLRLLESLVRADLPPWMEVRLDLGALAFTAGLVLLTGLLAGLSSALAGTGDGRSVGQVASVRSSSGRGLARLRNGLVVGEVALALTLLLGAGLMIRTLVALERQDLGFDAENLYTVRVDPPYWTYQETEPLARFYREVLPRLKAIPGVQGAAANQNLPLAGLDEATKQTVTVEGQASEEQEANPFVHLQSVDPGYFQTMGIRLLDGRPFAPEDHLETPPVAVASQSLAVRLWPGESALDRRLKLGAPDSDAPWLTIVGIVGDVRSENRVGAASPDLYLSHLQHFTGDTYFALRTTLEGPEVFRQVEAAVQSVDPDLALFDAAPMRERVARVEWQRRVTGTLFSTFGLLALGLAAIGIYGLISQRVEQRRKELGIRLALGARPRDLFSDVLRQGFRLFLLGTAAGLAAGFLLVRFVRSLLFGVGAADPWSALGAWGLLLLVALAACFVPARRAARHDPTRVLRSEG